MQCKCNYYSRAIDARFLTNTTMQCTCNCSSQAIGSRFLTERVEALRPDVHVFGHTHFGWDATLSPSSSPSSAAAAPPSVRGATEGGAAEAVAGRARGAGDEDDAGDAEDDADDAEHQHCVRCVRRRRDARSGPIDPLSPDAPSCSVVATGGHSAIAVGGRSWRCASAVVHHLSCTRTPPTPPGAVAITDDEPETNSPPQTHARAARDAPHVANRYIQPPLSYPQERRQRMGTVAVRTRQ